MLGLLFALITVSAWGTWISVSQNVHFKNQQIKNLYVTGAAMIVAFGVMLTQPAVPVNFNNFWLPFLGGLVWAVSGLCAFIATDKIGMARANGIWAPINIVVSMLWGAVLFNEFPNSDALTIFLILLYLAMIIGGALLIIFARNTGGQNVHQRALVVGLICAVATGFLWGSYFIPIKISGVSSWVAAFPLTVGMFAGSLVMFLLTRASPRLDKHSDYVRVLISGVLWTVGNYSMLLLVEQIGAGRGFTIAQLAVVINALIGIYILKDPKPKTRAAWLTLTGCVIAILGGILLGNLK